MSKNTLLLFTPFLVTETRHVAMAQAQAALAGRLRPHMGMEIFSVGVLDYCAPSLHTDLLKALEGFDACTFNTGRGRPNRTGIVGPTLHLLDRVPERFRTENLIVGRIIQDCFVTDARALALRLQEEIHGAPFRDWIAGNVQPVDKPDDIEKSTKWMKKSPYCRGFVTVMHHVQGALMLAPYRTWKSLYQMPEGLDHHYDDVLFSQHVVQNNGCWLHIGGRYHTHRHQATEDEARYFINPPKRTSGADASDKVRILPYGTVVVSALELFQEVAGRSPRFILETGSLRSNTPEDGHSTLKVARWIRNLALSTAPEFVSIDLDTSVAQAVLFRRGFCDLGSFYEGDSRRVLRDFRWNVRPPLDVALLDSAEDPQVTLEEFQLLEPHLSPEAIVVIDDYDTKGKLAIPYAAAKGWSWTPVDRTAVLRRAR